MDIFILDELCLNILQVASLLPDEAFTVVRKSFDARKVCSVCDLFCYLPELYVDDMILWGFCSSQIYYLVT